MANYPWNQLMQSAPMSAREREERDYSEYQKQLAAQMAMRIADGMPSPYFVSPSTWDVSKPKINKKLLLLEKP